MITEQQYSEALEQEKIAKEIISQYNLEKLEGFKQRMKDNPIFTDDELHYSAISLCPCGHGLAYPKECSPWHYWDCSAILKGVADPKVIHTGQLPFIFYNVKGESEHNGTTRGVFKPQAQTI